MGGRGNIFYVLVGMLEPICRLEQVIGNPLGACQGDAQYVKGTVNQIFVLIIGGIGIQLESLCTLGMSV